MTQQTDWTENLPHQKGATGMTYNTLKLDQQLEFVEFLKNHSYPDGTSIKTIADEATKDLGFVVTENNVRTTAKAAKIELPAARVPKLSPVDELRLRVDLLEIKMNNLLGSHISRGNDQTLTGITP